MGIDGRLDSPSRRPSTGWLRHSAPGTHLGRIPAAPLRGIPQPSKYPEPAHELRVSPVISLRNSAVDHGRQYLICGSASGTS